MAFNFGQFNEFSDSVTFADPVVEAVARAIQLSPWTGRIYQAMGAPATTISTKEFEVYKRTKTSRNGVIGGNWDDDDVTGLAISSASLAGLTIGHVLKVGSEVVIVSAVNRANNTISVYARGAGGTTAAAHTSGDAFAVIGYAGSDTDLKNVDAVSESTTVWTNYVQTVFEVIDWTKHAELQRKGLDAANATVILVQDAEHRVAELLAKMAVLGVKQQASDASDRFMSAGLIAQLGDVTNRGANVYNVSGDLTEVKFKAALKQLFDAGGRANVVWCSPTVKDYINAFIGSSLIQLNDTPANHVAGGVYANAYDFEGQLLQVEVDADMPNDQIAVVNSSKLRKGWLANDGLRLVDEPQKSSREFRRSLQGSVGFLVEDVGIDHILLTGITGGTGTKVHSVNVVNSTIAETRNIIVNADSEVPAAAAANFGYTVTIGTAWTSGTKITTAVKGEVWASNGSAWVKQA